MSKFRVYIYSDLDYEEMVANINYENEEFALISQEEGIENIKLEIYKPINSESWICDIHEMENAIRQAKERLIGSKKMDED